MRSAALGLGVASTLLAGASAAQIDIVSQAIAVDVGGAPEDTTLVIDAVVEATATAGAVTFYRPLLPVTLAQVDGQPATVEPHPTYPEYASRIVFPQALAAGDTAAIHLELAGTPTCTVPGYPGVFCTRSPSETVLTTAMPGVAWYLVNAFALDPFVGTIAVRAPAAHTVVAGTFESVEAHGDGTSTHQFRFDVATELLAVYAGAADTLDGGSVQVIHHADRHDADNVALAAEVAAGVLPILESHYGELPVDPARIVVVPQSFGFGGLGLLGTVLLNEVVVGPAAYLIEQGIAHELSHSWWGNLASGADPNEARFFGESFAEYAGWRALGELRGDAVRTSGMRMNAVWYMYRRPENVDVPVISNATSSSPAAVHVIYHKGPLVLRTLEQAAGEDAFAEALRALIARGYGGLSLDALIADLAAASGYDASAAVEQWLRGTGFPRIVAAARVEETAVALSLTTDQSFDLALPVRLVLADGRTVDEVVPVATGEHLIAADERPIAVEIDPRWTAVREITPALQGDVTLDGEVDGADLVALAVAHGGALPFERRVDGRYDPLHDLDRDGLIGDADLEIVRASISARLASRSER